MVFVYRDWSKIMAGDIFGILGESGAYSELKE